MPSERQMRNLVEQSTKHLLVGVYIVLPMSFKDPLSA